MSPSEDFTRATLGAVDKPVHRLGLSFNFGVDAAGVETLHGADHAQEEWFTHAMSQRRRLCPTPFARDRLEPLDDGKVRYRFKRAWKHGSTAVDHLARICALVPPPRFTPTGPRRRTGDVGEVVVEDGVAGFRRTPRSRRCCTAP